MKQDVVVEDAQYPKYLARDRHDRHSREKQERQQHPAQHDAHLVVEIVREDPLWNLHRANRADVLQPISPTEVGMSACPTDEGFRYEVSDWKGVGIAIVRESIEFVALLPMLDP